MMLPLRLPEWSISHMRNWKKPADSAFVMWTVIILFVLGLLSIVSGVTPVVDPGALILP